LEFKEKWIQYPLHHNFKIIRMGKILKKFLAIPFIEILMLDFYIQHWIAPIDSKNNKLDTL